MFEKGLKSLGGCEAARGLIQGFPSVFSKLGSGRRGKNASEYRKQRRPLLEGHDRCGTSLADLRVPRYESATRARRPKHGH